MTEIRSFKRILILGGTGFIGTALLRNYKPQKTKITCLVHQRNLPPEFNDVKTINASITKFNWDKLSKKPPDVIYHLARIPGPGKIGRYLASRNSAKANKSLLKWMNKQTKPPLLIFVAGTLAYGSHGDAAITEDTPLNPTSYAKEYEKGENPILKSYITKKLPIMILRPAWVYGYGSWFYQFFLKPIKENNYIPMYGTGENWMSFVHINDCAGMIRYISENAPSNFTYNIYSGSPIKQKTFIKILSELIPDIPIKQFSTFELSRKYGRAMATAFNFSLKVKTKHKNLYQNYKLSYPNLKNGLKNILTGFHNI